MAADADCGRLSAVFIHGGVLRNHQTAQRWLLRKTSTADGNHVEVTRPQSA
jgi:hypothetical protein